MEITSQSDSLSSKTVARDMSQVLNYQVVVLRMEKKDTLTRNSYSYVMFVYTLDGATLITRSKFEK